MKRGRRVASSNWAACTSSAPNGTKPGASTCSFAAAAAARATPAAAASISRCEDDLMRIFAGEWVEEHPHPAGHAGRRGDRKPDGHPPHRSGPEEGRGTQLRDPQEPARIRRGDGRAAEAGLRLPPGDPRRRQLQGADPGDDRRAGQTNLQAIPQAETTAPKPSPPGPATGCRRARRPRLPRHRTSPRPNGSPRTRPSGWPKARCSTRSTRTCPRTTIPGEWNWEALAKLANTRWGLHLRDRDLKKVGRDQVGEFLIDKAREAIGKVDLSEGAEFLDDDFPLQDGLRLGAAQVRPGSLDLSEIQGLEPPALDPVGPRTGRRGLRRERIRVPGDGRALPLQPAHARPARRGSTARRSAMGPAAVRRRI